VAIQIYMMEKQ